MKRRSNIWTVMRKELARFFGDKRMVVTTILLPGILIYAMYAFMGSALSDMLSVDEDYKTSVCTVNLPASAAMLLGETNYEVTEISSAGEIEDAKAAIADKELDILMVFSESFDEEVELYDSLSGGTAPSAEIYYNSTRTESGTAYSALYAMLDAYESALANKFDVNPGGEGFDLASEKDASGFVFSSMLPMLMMIFLFSGCMGVAPEAIAGEKERGTIATMLITPLKRSELAIGKIVSLAFIALLSGISSAVGTILSLPKLMGAGEEGISVFYTASDYLMLAAVVLSTVLLFISLISIISAYAKTIKEAATAVMPLMIVAMLVGVTAMFSSGAQESLYFYFIPIYNSVQAMVGIFSFNAMPASILATTLTNLLFSVASGYVLTRMFNSEKCMFNK